MFNFFLVFIFFNFPVIFCFSPNQRRSSYRSSYHFKKKVNQSRVIREFMVPIQKHPKTVSFHNSKSSGIRSTTHQVKNKELNIFGEKNVDPLAGAPVETKQLKVYTDVSGKTLGKYSEVVTFVKPTDTEQDEDSPPGYSSQTEDDYVDYMPNSLPGRTLEEIALRKSNEQSRIGHVNETQPSSIFPEKLDREVPLGSPERRYRQYILGISMDEKETRLSLWSVIVKLSMSRSPEIEWTTIEKDTTIQFALRPSILDILSKAHFHDMESVCSHLLYHGLDLPGLLQNITLRGPDNALYSLDVVAESDTPILPEVAVMLRSTAGLRDLSIREWTRLVGGQEEGIYKFLSTNFLRRTLDALSLAKKERRRIVHYLRHSLVSSPSNCPINIGASTCHNAIRFQDMTSTIDNGCDTSNDGACEDVASEFTSVLNKEKRQPQQLLNKEVVRPRLSNHSPAGLHMTPTRVDASSGGAERSLSMQKKNQKAEGLVVPRDSQKRLLETDSFMTEKSSQKTALFNKQHQWASKGKDSRKIDVSGVRRIQSLGLNRTLSKRRRSEAIAKNIRTSIRNESENLPTLTAVASNKLHAIHGDFLIEPHSNPPTLSRSSLGKKTFRCSKCSLPDRANINHESSSKLLKKMIRQIDVNGIIDIGSDSMQIVFPVEDVLLDSPIGVVELTDKYLPSSIFPELQVFASSYMNLGADRALGLLMKQHCERTSTQNRGICFFPCFNRGWRSRCIPGHPLAPYTSNNTILEIKGNSLHPVATYCDKSNSVALQSASIEYDCQQAAQTLFSWPRERHSTELVEVVFSPSIGLPLSKPYEERIKIQHCDVVHGTGDFEQCSSIITKLLLKKQLPANQEVSSFCPVTPSEIGDFLSPTTLLYITNNATVEPVLTFKALGLMPEKSDQPSADFHVSRHCERFVDKYQPDPLPLLSEYDCQ